MKKKNKFRVTLVIDALVNVPYVQGHFFAKVKMMKGGDVCGVSNRQPVSNHEVVWNETIEFDAKLYTDVKGTLIPCFLQASIKQETNGGKSSVKLGVVILDLVQFAGEGLVKKRYLLQSANGAECKENSILKMSIKLTQISGDPVFRTAPVQMEDSDDGSLSRTENASNPSQFKLSDLDKSLIHMQDIANLSSEGMGLAPSEFLEWKKTRISADVVLDRLFQRYPPVFSASNQDINVQSDDDNDLTDLLLSSDSLNLNPDPL